MSNARAVNGQPLSLYVETLLVTDVSIYNDHVVFSGSTTPATVFQSMKIYFAHVMNGVSIISNFKSFQAS